MKKSQEKEIERLLEEKLREYTLKGITMGSEITSKMVLDFIEKGKDLKEIKNYLEIILKGELRQKLLNHKGDR